MTLGELMIDREDWQNYIYGRDPKDTFEVLVTRDGENYYCAVKSAQIDSEEEGLEWLDYEADMALRTLEEQGVTDSLTIELVKNDKELVASITVKCTETSKPVMLSTISYYEQPKQKLAN